jgi:predicted amidohydrolase YtcJ
LVLAFLLSAGLATAQSSTTVLFNGKILTEDPKSTTAEAVAIRDGRIIAAGTSADLRKMAGPQARWIDLEGRTVIPGLIDSHMHAIRAALSFSTEVNWIGTRSLAEALGRIREAAHSMAPGAWLIVAGGWNAQQFSENRRPTQVELVAAAPENPVYI